MQINVQRSNFGSDNVFGYQLHEEKYNFHLHIHQFVELTLVLEGELEVTVDGGEPEVATGGDFILIFPFQSHKYASSKVNKFAIYTFSPSLISEFINRADGNVGERSVFKASKSTYDLFCSKLMKEKDLGYFSVRSCLYAMLGDFSRQVDLCRRKTDKGLIEKIVVFVNENYKSRLSLDVVAKGIGYSESYVSHAMKKSFGFNFSTLLAIVRSERAKTLLIEDGKTSLEIAIECGFGCERSFNRNFKSVTGISPMEYRKVNKMTIVDKKDFTNAYFAKAKDQSEKEGAFSDARNA